MVSAIDYQKANQEKVSKNKANVTYDICGKKLKYCSKNRTKNVERRSSVKYACGAARMAGKSSSCVAPRIGGETSSSTKSLARKSLKSDSQSYLESKRSSSPKSAKSESKKKHATTETNESRAERSVLNSKCYFQLPRARKNACTKEHRWYHEKYVKDDCGSGVVPLKHTYSISRKDWCKTPLSMYQATIGELGRKLLCKEEIVPRDVWPGPPCNIEEYILPRCYGYYRKYECVRPCHSEHVYLSKEGKVRDRVERYWNPCLTEEQKVKIDINEFAPQNAFLGQRLRRTHIDGDPCWWPPPLRKWRTLMRFCRLNARSANSTFVMLFLIQIKKNVVKMLI